MQTGIAQLKKLRSRSFREVHERGRQELRKLGERLFGSGAGEISDGVFLRGIRTSSRNGSGEGTAALIAARIRAGVVEENGLNQGPFLPSLARRAEIVDLMECRFPAERGEVIERAERAIAGRFDLLGLRDVSFGDPIDWHLEPVSGKRTSLAHWSRIDFLDPHLAGDKKVTWELNRHRHFMTLGQAYWLTADERYAEAFVHQASSWMEANPPKRGINWASSLELAFRSIAWTWALHLFAPSPRLTPRFVLDLFKHLQAHGRHIASYLSHFFSPNTHLTGEALGLLYLGTAFPEFAEADAWRDQALRVLDEQLTAQVRSDGVYFEQTTYYHRYTADFYLHLAVIGRANRLALPGGLSEKLSLILDHLMWITRPDGTSPLVGDDDGGRLVGLGERDHGDFRDTLALGAALFGRADWKFVSGGLASEILWLLGPEGLARYDAVEAVPPEAESRAFTAGGYYVMRDGWARDSSYVLVDCGPHGALGCAHAHSDALSFEFASRGVTWLVDPGTFTYTADAALRDAFRTTAAHNTVTVDGESQSIPAGPFSWRQIATSSVGEFIAERDFDYFEGTHDGYERLSDPVIHSRSILFVKAADGEDLPPYLIVRDAFAAHARHQYAVRYHLPAGCLATLCGNVLRAGPQGGDTLSIAALGGAQLQGSVESGWVSRCYGSREPAPVGVFEAEADGPYDCVSVIVPVAAGEGIVDIARQDRAGAGGRSLSAEAICSTWWLPGMAATGATGQRFWLTGRWRGGAS